MSDFDYDKLKDMKYDPDRGIYIGEDGSELRVTPYSNGSGYKVDYYNSTTYGNKRHNSTHLKTDLNENWEKTDNDRENGTQKKKVFHFKNLSKVFTSMNLWMWKVTKFMTILN